MVFNALGLPEGVLSLAGLRQTFAEAVAGIRREHAGPVGAKVAETFEWLPLRAVVFHDDAQLPLDFEGTGPCGCVSLWLGIHPERPVILAGQSPSRAPHRWVVKESRQPRCLRGLSPGRGPGSCASKGFDYALLSAWSASATGWRGLWTPTAGPTR